MTASCLDSNYNASTATYTFQFTVTDTTFQNCDITLVWYDNDTPTEEVMTSKTISKTITATSFPHSASMTYKVTPKSTMDYENMGQFIYRIDYNVECYSSDATKLSSLKNYYINEYRDIKDASWFTDYKPEVLYFQTTTSGQLSYYNTLAAQSSTSNE